MNRAEIWWCEDPESGRRPVCILTRAEAIPALLRLVVVPATTTIRGIPSELRLDESDGMPTACTLSFDNTFTVPKALLVERITRLSIARQHEMCRALRVATGC